MSISSNFLFVYTFTYFISVHLLTTEIQLLSMIVMIQNYQECVIICLRWCYIWDVGLGLRLVWRLLSRYPQIISLCALSVGAWMKKKSALDLHSSDAVRYCLHVMATGCLFIVSLRTLSSLLSVVLSVCALQCVFFHGVSGLIFVLHAVKAWAVLLQVQQQCNTVAVLLWAYFYYRYCHFYCYI